MKCNKCNNQILNTIWFFENKNLCEECTDKLFKKLLDSIK